MPASDAAPTSELPRGELILAVDTGGTKTAAWLVEIVDADSHQLLGQARTSAGNPNSVGFERATQAIHEACRAAQQLANCADRRITRAVMSIAGAANRETARRFGEWASNVGVADRVAIVSDVLPILAAGTPDCCGVALIAGTGSSAFARAADGRSKRCGGWGYLLGDEGSGYAIGRAALQHALRALETGSRDALAEKVIASLGVKSVTELTRAVYGNADARHTVAGFCRLVSELADKGDTLSREIFAAAAADLAELAARAAAAVGILDAGFPLAASGGALINSALLQEMLRANLARRGLNCEINVVTEPLAGCVRLAAPKHDGTLVTWHSN
ncbi:MAG: BadF/BadG/BcrA/BcrD ATPase family protein [Pirellulales bacterium]